MNLLALCGRKFSGKSHIANWLDDSTVKVKGRRQELIPSIRSFASPLKDMLAVLPIDDIEERLYGKMKEEPEHLVLGGQSMRHAMVTLGTEWGRNLVNPNIWIDCMKASLLKDEDEDPGKRLFIIDDLRFDNEAALVKSLGGIVIAIRSKGEAEAGTHASETLDIDKFYGLLNSKIDNKEFILNTLSAVTPWSFFQDDNEG